MTRGKNCCSEQFIQYVKLILLILLISIVGWSGYAIWKAYDQESINLYIFDSSSTQYHDGESSTISNKLLSLPSNKSEETLETTTRQNISLNNDVSSSEIYSTDNPITTMKIPESSIIHDILLRNSENTNTEETIKDSFESSINDDDKKLKITMPSLDKGMTEEEKNSTDEEEFERYFSLIWPVYSGFIPILDYNSKEDSSAQQAWYKRLNEEFEKSDENMEFSKFQDNSSKKEDLSDDQKDENNRSYEKDVPSSAEIMNNLKILHESIDAMKKNLSVENHQIVDYLSPKEDESSNHLVSELGRQDSTETPSSIPREDSEITKSYLIHVPLSKDDTYDYPLEKFDTSKVDDASSNLKTESLESLDLDSWLFYQGLKRQDNNAETSSTDTFRTRQYSDVSMSATEENDDDRIKTRRTDVNPAISSSTENVNSEEGIFFTNSKTGDLIESDICNDCYSATSSEDYKSDASMQEDVEDDVSFPNHYSSLVEVHTTENSLNDMTLSNKNIDTKDSSIEQEPIDISIDSENSEYYHTPFSAEEWRYRQFPDEYYPYDLPAHTNPIRWWLNKDKYHRGKLFGDHMILRKKRGIAKIMSGQSTL